MWQYLCIMQPWDDKLPSWYCITISTLYSAFSAWMDLPGNRIALLKSVRCSDKTHSVHSRCRSHTSIYDCWVGCVILMISSWIHFLNEAIQVDRPLLTMTHMWRHNVFIITHVWCLGVLWWHIFAAFQCTGKKKRWSPEYWNAHIVWATMRVVCWIVNYQINIGLHICANTVTVSWLQII